MKIFVTGTRGIPNIPGGIEKHCQELYPRIVEKNHEVIIAVRKRYMVKSISEWKGVKIINCFAPSKKSTEAIIHTFIALFKACYYRSDIIHIHGIGPALLTPIARIMGLKVVVTSQGPDYDRQKWGKIAKFVLRLGEKIGGKFANEVIVVSSTIGEIIRERCQRDSNLIYNGVAIPKQSREIDYLTQIGVVPGQYILSVCRFVPEKGLHDLIKAFRTIGSDQKLLIVGEADHETDYSKNLRSIARADPRIILTGYITGEPLNQVFSHCRLFVLPSYHEGLSLALLEALSYGLPALVSDIPANKEIGLFEEWYFRCGDSSDLKSKMQVLLDRALTEQKKQEMRRLIEEKYSWDVIAKKTVDVYEKALRA